MGKLDEGKLEQFFTNEGMTAARCKSLAKKLKTADVFEVEIEELPRDMRFSTRDKIEVEKE